MRQVGRAIEEARAHPARTVVLLPFFHLLQPAREAWAAQVPSGFSPRMETTRSWSGVLAWEPQALDFARDAGRDLLTARTWLEKAGQSARADVLAGAVVEAAGQLAEVAAAIPPGERAAWAARGRAGFAGLEGGLLAVEAVVAGIAIEWAAASSYATDALHEADLEGDLDLLVVVQGLRPDRLAESLAQRLEGKAVVLPLDEGAQRGDVRLHAADDAADEAQRAAACVLRHVEAGRVPVALPAVDRVLARRIAAMLEQCGVAIRDETGWKLSTTRAGAQVMLALRACRWDAGCDAVIDWLKNMPEAGTNSVLALERRVRRAGVRDWGAVQPALLAETGQALLARVNAWRERLAGARPLPEWLSTLRRVLAETGQLALLERDPAGCKVLGVLGLEEGADEEFGELPQARRRFGLQDFSRWIDECLESASFLPPAPAGEQVVMLPLQQLLGRPFAALVLAGCDERRLPAAPEPPGAWTPAQRELLGLPSREDLEREVRAAWEQALRVPVCDLLWRHGDEAGETLMPSALVQQIQLEAGGSPGAEHRVAREVPPAPVQRPAAIGAALPLERISASTYEDLRRCPYRFFALRQLGLQEPDEIDKDIDKRDFGTWLHQVLRTFHERLAAEPRHTLEERLALLDEIEDEVTRRERLDHGEFLPFRAAWPQVRDGYLQWLQSHEAQESAVFHEAESERERPLGAVKLVGRIDRIDRLPDGTLLVMDYKTEGRKVTQDRVASPGEDTQLAFYAALLHEENVRAAYVNVGERGETALLEQEEVLHARDALVEGMLHDLERIGAGEPMPALGEGIACEYCAARGLCRRDFWS